MARAAIVFAPVLLFGCTILTDLDSLQFVKDGGVSSDGSVETGTDAGAPDADATTPDATADADATPADAGKTWIDDFNRANNGILGNGWLMKSAALHIGNNKAVVQQINSAYQNNVSYRPTNEDVRDVTVSVEFTPTAVPPGFPQVMARIQQNTVQANDTLDCYIFFVSNKANEAVLGRQRGTPYLVTLTALPLNPPIDTSHAYRLTLTATGANPVSLTGTVEIFQSGNWMKVNSAIFTDADPARLDTPGSVGLGASSNEATGLYAYDNFTRTSL